MQVALLFGGERGLKQASHAQADLTSGRSPFRRGAWIETGVGTTEDGSGVVALLFGGERGLKQYGPTKGANPMSRSPFRRGAWIETVMTLTRKGRTCWSLSFSEGSVD